MTLIVSSQTLSKSYNTLPVLNDISFVLNDGERIGLVGANGVGKSTLLRIIAGEESPDGGALTIKPGARLGYLPQTITGFDDRTLADLIASATDRLTALENRMRQLEAGMSAAGGDALDGILAEYGDVAEQFERGGGYEIAHKIDAVLTGLGVAHIPRTRRFGTLSGGEKARAGLALLLLQAPDALLLDEPTNHLDYASLTWLEEYLRAYPGAALVVSHDRQFLNRVVTMIVEIDEHSRAARRYTGTYDDYQRAKAHERRKWEAEYAAQQEEIKALRLEIKVTARSNANDRVYIRNEGDKYLRNFKKAGHEHTVSRRVRSAEEKLKRIEAASIPPPPAPLRFEADFDPQALKGRSALRAYDICKAFDGRRVLDGVSLDLEKRDRVLLVGPNGAGKSTLLKILAGIETPDAGEVTVNPAVTLGYLDQEQVLDPALTVFEAYRHNLPGTDQQLKSILLWSGLFRYEELDKRAGELSTGQRRKVQIARLIAGRCNLLLLDEPTNHISFDVLEELETALADFPGPVLAVTHDRHFMARFDGQVWELRDGALIKHLGGYADYIAAQTASQVADA